jgi:hypothetical protein
MVIQNRKAFEVAKNLSFYYVLVIEMTFNKYYTNSFFYIFECLLLLQCQLLLQHFLIIYSLSVSVISRVRTPSIKCLLANVTVIASIFYLTFF